MRAGVVGGLTVAGAFTLVAVIGWVTQTASRPVPADVLGRAVRFYALVGAASGALVGALGRVAERRAGAVGLGVLVGALIGVGLQLPGTSIEASPSEAFDRVWLRSWPLCSACRADCTDTVGTLGGVRWPRDGASSQAK
jgi:hypothetical protein